MKKQFLVIVSSILLMLLVVGCGRERGASRKDIESMPLVTDNREWVDAIGLFDNFDTTPFGVGEGYDNGILRVYINCDKGVESYETMAGIINAHNSFVDSNPGYFSEGKQIVFVCSHSSQYNSFYVFNEENGPARFQEYEDMLGQSATAKFQYMNVELCDLGSYDKSLLEMKTKIDVPVLILHERQIKEYSQVAESNYEILNQFSGLEQVVIDFGGMDYNIDDVYSTIQKYAPGVKVFDVGSMSYVN